MSLRTRRAVRLLVAVAFTWVGVALFAHAALAWEAKIQVAKVNAGGAANDAFVFQPTITSTSGSAITAPFSLKGGELTAPFDVRCNAGNDCFSDLTQRVTEQPTPGYTLKDVSCRNTQGTNGNFADPPGPSSPLKPASEVSTDLATGTVDLKAHFLEWVLCTFTNAPVAAPPLPVPIAAPSAPARRRRRRSRSRPRACGRAARSCVGRRVPDLRRGRRARDRQAHRPRDVLRREPEGQDAPQAQSRQRVDALGEAAAPPGARAVPSTRARGVRGVEPHEAQDPADGREPLPQHGGATPVHRLTARKAWPRLPRRGAAT